MKRTGLRSQTKNNMSKNDYKKLENKENSDEYEKISLNELENENVKFLGHKSPNRSDTENEVDVSDKVKFIQPGEDHEDDRESVDENKHDDEKHQVGDLKKDYGNIALLMFLYFLQGVPLGLTGSLPFILSSRKVSYADQGTFSFAFWPFSLKLLWAPIVDSIYFKSVGRRKSWLVPIQYLIGVFMLIFASYTKELLEGKNPHSYDIYILTGIFFMFTFLAATQDIAVDGWALTMLSKENVSWGSTCNSVGQTAGWFAGQVIFLTIESADFSNKYIRPMFGLKDQTYGIVTIEKFMLFFGVLFIISTTLVLLFKREIERKESDPSDKKEHSIEDDLTVKQTYKLMWKIVWLAPIKKIMLILMTVKICFAVESMSYLKMIESGVPKEKLGLLAVPLTPLQIVLPLLISRYTNGPKPFNLFIKAIPFRLFMGLVVAGWVYITPSFKEANNEYPLYYYGLCLLINAVHSIFTYSMFVSQMSFFAKISDKTIGGSYMTFLNTVSNMGGSWPSTMVLYLADFITVKNCVHIPKQAINNTASAINSTVLELINKNKCGSDAETKNCTSLGGDCATKLDAFYVETVACTIFGIFWIIYFKKIMYNLQALPKKAWKLPKLTF